VLPRSFVTPSVMLGILMLIFVKPTHVFLDEMIGNPDDCLVFELQSLPGLSKVTISVVKLFYLVSEVCAMLFRHILWENVRRVDGGITEVKYTKILFLFGSSIDLSSMTRLLFASDGWKDCLCLYPVL
jgi:hypothetical protein